MSGPTPAYVSRRRSSLDDESDEPTASPRAQSTTKRSRLESGLSSVEHLAHDVVVAAETVESGASVGRRMVSRRRFEQVDDPRRMNECVDWDGAGQQRREKFESGRSRHGIDSFRASVSEEWDGRGKKRQLDEGRSLNCVCPCFGGHCCLSCTRLESS